MHGLGSKIVVPIAVTVWMTAPSLAAPQGEVKGSFVLRGVDAKLVHVRAERAALDAKGKMGYSVLLSERPAKDALGEWKTADPAQRGSFIFLQLEGNGDVWVAELGHAARAGGRFGVVMELQKAAFEVRGDRLTAHVR